MAKIDHFALRFGPCATPKFRYGQTVTCLMRGEVEIVGLTNAPIPWPKCRTGRKFAIVLYGALAGAVRRESNLAVAHAWGVTGQTVTKWRKALGVQSVNEGTSVLISDNSTHSPGVKRGLRKTWTKARDPVRREKIAAAKRGKARPPEVVEKMRAAATGRRHSAEARRKMSKAQRKRGAWPPAAGRPWTAEEDNLVKTLPAAEVARRTGRTIGAVRCRWQSLGLPDRRASGLRAKPKRKTEP